MRVNSERLLSTFLDLVRIPSPSFNERAVADYILAQVKGLGFAVEEDNAAAPLNGNCGNLLVRIPATDPTLPKLFICSHMDTVERGDEPIVPVVDDAGNIRSAGETIVAADDKTGVAVQIELLRLIAEHKPNHGELIIAFTVGEEKEVRGMQEIPPQVYAGFDAGIALDHSYPDSVIIGAPAKVAIQITIHGVGGHAAFPEQRINAAQVLARTVSRLPSKRLDEFSTANLGIIRSGEAINVIPATAYAEYELRSHKEDLLDFHLSHTLSTIESTVREARLFISASNKGGIGDDTPEESNIRKATVEVDVTSCYESYRLDDSSLPVTLLKSAITENGMEFKSSIAQGGSDANVLNAHGLPSAVLGCGMHGVHSVTERANLEEMCKCTEVLLATIQQKA